MLNESPEPFDVLVTSVTMPRSSGFTLVDRLSEEAPDLRVIYMSDAMRERVSWPGVPGAAFRGFGAPQVHFAAEMQMNKLAAALHMDPVELRWRNALREGDTLDVGTPPPGGVVTRQVIEAPCSCASGPASISSPTR